MTAPSGAPLLLEARDIQKRFGRVVALRAGNFALRPNEVHAIVGDNGAGKSTLIKIVSGVTPADAGELLLDGQPVAIAWGTRIVIMDEPTAALGVRESGMVLELIKEVRSHGLAVIMISHNLPEVFAVADRITVLRLGRTITTLSTADTSLDAVVGMM